MILTFADELATFCARTIDPGYSALILLGTRQATTAALLIGTLRVQRIGFLLTDETREMPAQVATLLKCTTDSWMCPPGDHSTTLRVYEGLRLLMESWSDLDHTTIAVDVTGGLKPMSLGLEKAAHVLGLKTIYIQSEYEKLPDGRVVVKPGTQWLEIPPDPYLVFGHLEDAEARRLYVAHDYASARRIFVQLAARVPSADGAQYSALAELSAMYAAWDVLDFTTAAQHAAALLKQEPVQPPVLANHNALFMEQHALLQGLTSTAAAVVRHDDEARQTLAEPEAVLPLLGTLHAAALRRAKHYRYDFAALFRYRCLELISQHRLAKHGIVTNQPNYRATGIERAALTERFKAIQQQVGRRDLRKLPERNIALFDSYMLLAALDDPLLHGYPVKRIEDRSAARNQSVLAHGYRLIDQSEYVRFAEVVDEIIDRLFTQVLGCPRARWEQATQFIDPFAS